MLLLYHEHNKDVVGGIFIQCRNFNRKPNLYLKDETVEEIITPLVLNSVDYNVGLSRVISSNKQTKYETYENNPFWLNKVPWYSTTIYSKLHVTVFEDFIRNDRRHR